MKALASGARLEIFETLDSTSLEARRRAATGAGGPLWIAALYQSAGYGRRGSQWRQQNGDVAATFMFRPEAPVERLPELSFVAAVAVLDAIRRFAPSAPLSLKWPNDILADGKKIAGLLLELAGAPGAPVVTLGVGVNIVSAPQGLDYPTARLLDFAPAPPHPRAFVETLDEVFDAQRKVWLQDGFAAIRSQWLGRAAHKGERIRVKLPAETIEGVFTDLDLSGALILDCDGVRRTIAAGAVLPASGIEKRR
ncbi:MAG: biotin--[acetyl-CoA-carboxylase] ligase [Alphaproteobacteria bacterium RIFCSPHIGHO2_12_FULL_63_12]|nr:MAG: biotin--[acetyl-CoA-carboxylase] ligase [Alphaproteobacteria bacterium RIFCSPHIGHO2_12_FULL_63_12]